MAAMSLTNESQLIDTRIIEDVAAEVVIQCHPGIEDRPRAFHGFTAATAVLIGPTLENLAQAYRQACCTPCGRNAARIFLNNLLEAEA